MSPTLHWLCEAPSPYNAELFRAISAAPGFELTVWYHRLTLGTHPWQSDLTAGYASAALRPQLGLPWGLVARAAHSLVCPDARTFVLGGWDHPTAWALILLLSLRPRASSSLVIWTDTPDTTRPRTGLRQRVRAAALRWCFTRARAVMGTGRPALEALAAMGAPEEALVNFPYWIALERYGDGRPAQDQEDGPVVFLSSGQVDLARKGHDVAVQALALASRRVGRELFYWIAGTGPDVAKVEALAEHLGIRNRVAVLGWLEPDELARKMSSVQAFLHPSPVHEPYGVAVLEAMASGLPVLTSDVTGAGRDRVLDGINGWLHPAGDAEVLADQMAALATSPDRARRMGQAARDTAAAWPVSRAIDILRTVLAPPGSRPPPPVRPEV